MLFTKGKVRKEENRSYSDALLKGSNLIMCHLLSDSYIHVGHIAEEVDDSSTG